MNTSSNDNLQPKNLIKHFQTQGDWIEPANKTHMEEIDCFLSDINNNKNINTTNKSITITEVKGLSKYQKVGKSWLLISY